MTTAVLVVNVGTRPVEVLQHGQRVWNGYLNVGDFIRVNVWKDGGLKVEEVDEASL